MNWKYELKQWWYLFWGELFGIQSWRAKGLGYTDKQARIKQVRTSLDWKTRKRIFEQDDYTCQYCGWQDYTRTGWGLELEHIIPLASKDGTNNDENLTTACIRCNRKKGAKIL